MFEAIELFSAYLVILWLGHLVGDWLLQPHAMAIAKTTDAQVRWKHCNIYTACVGLSFIAISPQISNTTYVLLLGWLFLTHYFIDSYKPLYWFRKLGNDPHAKCWASFKDRFSDPIGALVYITLDQIFHLFCLVPIAIILTVLK